MDRLLLLIILIVLGAAFVALGWFFVRLGMTARAFDRQIAAAGIDGEAAVIDHRISYGRGSHTNHITYAYTVKAAGGEPQTITQETSVSSDDYERLNIGDKFPIRYLPNSPKEVVLRGGVHEQTVPFFLNAGIGLIVIGALVILLGIFIELR